MFFLLNKCFPSVKTSNYIHKYSQIAFASDRVANAKKGARTSLFPRSPHLFSSSYSLLLSSASTDADARIGRRGCSWRPMRMTFVDVSQCQTFTFYKPNRCFCGSRPPFPYLTPSFSYNIFLCFLWSVVLSCCVHPLVAVLKNSLSRL